MSTLAPLASRPRLTFHKPAELDAETIDVVVGVMNRYVEAEPGWHRARLASADELILFRSEAGDVLGTTLLDIIDLEHEGTPCRVLFTGGVFLDPALRGRNMIQLAGALSYLRHGLATTRRVFWFSECSTARAFLLTTRNFSRSWPRPQTETPEWEGLYTELCATRLGPCWRPQQGTCKRARPVALACARICPKRQARDRDLTFFVSRNPGYLDGETLPVLVPLDLGNWLSVLGRALGRSFRDLARRLVPVRA